MLHTEMNKWYDVDKEEVQIFIGILLHIGALQYPRN